MAEGFLIASAHVDVEAKTKDAVQNITSLITKLVAVGPAAGGAATVAAGALGSITAGTISAGAAVGAFGLAAFAQKSSLMAMAKAQGNLNQAVKDYGPNSEQARKATEDWHKQAAAIPVATRDAGLGFQSMIDGYNTWSDALAGDTMPVFTKAFRVALDLLPQFTPLVKTASGVLSGMMDDIGKGVKSGGFKSFMTGLNSAAKQSLPNLLRAGKEVFRGIGGIIEAFLPSAGKATDGLANMAKKFGDWGQSLGKSDKFKNFMSFVSENGPKLAQALGNIATTGQKLWQAFSPLAGIQLTLFTALTKFVSMLPPPVILALALAVVALRVAMLGFSIASAITGTAMGPLIASTWAWTAALLANPITWIVLLIVGLVAVIVLIATKTTWFQQIWSATWGFIKATWDAVWGGLKTAWNAMGTFFSQTIPGWLTSLKNWFFSKWNAIKTDTSNALTATKNAIVNIFTSAVSWVQSKFNAWVNLNRTALTTIKNTVTSALDAVYSKVKSAFTSVVNAVRDKINSAVSTVKGFKNSVVNFFAGAGSWLVSSGQKLIQGFINGIKNMAGSVKNAVSNVLSGARNLLPFSPAKEGPFSGRGWTEYSGASLMQGLATGIDNSAGLPYQSMSNALGGVSGAPTTQAVPATGSSTNTYHVTVNMTGVVDTRNPGAVKQFATDLAPAFSVAMRNYEKERR